MARLAPIDYFQLLVAEDVANEWIHNTNSSGQESGLRESVEGRRL